jgi:ABC-type antimicrobial peptide transport system permease subunit
MPFLGLDDRSAPFTIAFPRNPSTAASYMSIGIRTAIPPASSLSAIRAVVEKLDPDLPIAELGTARSALIETIDKPRFLSGVMLGVGGISLLLTAIGIYGVLSYGVTQRLREIGLRIALGAAPQNVRSMVLKQVAWMAAIGIAIGVSLALLLGEVGRSLLFGLTPTDPFVPTAAVLALSAVVITAAYWPARRAALVDPVTALRGD